MGVPPNHPFSSFFILFHGIHCKPSILGTTIDGKPYFPHEPLGHPALLDRWPASDSLVSGDEKLGLPMLMLVKIGSCWLIAFLIAFDHL